MSQAQKFTLTIELGNEAMSSRRDIADVLEQLCVVLRRPEIASSQASPNGARATQAGRLFDANGNTVGKWGLE